MIRQVKVVRSPGEFRGTRAYFDTQASLPAALSRSAGEPRGIARQRVTSCRSRTMTNEPGWFKQNVGVSARPRTKLLGNLPRCDSGTPKQEAAIKAK